MPPPGSPATKSRPPGPRLRAAVLRAGPAPGTAREPDSQLGATWLVIACAMAALAETDAPAVSVASAVAGIAAAESPPYTTGRTSHAAAARWRAETGPSSPRPASASARAARAAGDQCSPAGDWLRAP